MLKTETVILKIYFLSILVHFTLSVLLRLHVSCYIIVCYWAPLPNSAFSDDTQYHYFSSLKLAIVQSLHHGNQQMLSIRLIYSRSWENFSLTSIKTRVRNSLKLRNITYQI